MILKGRSASCRCRIYRSAQRAKLKTGFLRRPAQILMDKSRIEAVARPYGIDHRLVQERTL